MQKLINLQKDPKDQQIRHLKLLERITPSIKTEKLKNKELKAL